MHEWGVDFGSPTIDIDAVRARKEKVITTLSGGLKQLAKKRKVQVIHARGIVREFADAAARRGRSGDYAEGDGSRSTTASWPPARFRRCRGVQACRTDRVMDSTGALELDDIPESCW